MLFGVTTFFYAYLCIFGKPGQVVIHVILKYNHLTNKFRSASQSSMVQWLSSSFYPFCRLFVCPAMVTKYPLFSIYTGIKALHYKPVPPSPDPVPSSINKYFFLLQIFSSFFSNFNCLTFLCQPEMSTVVR